MTLKLEYFEQPIIAEHIHTYLTQLPNIIFEDNANGPTIGYRVKNQKYKFATLHGGNSYQSIVFHVDPGNRETTIGKEKQKEIQAKLNFNIRDLKSHVLKAHEVYVPLEVLDISNTVDSLKDIILFACLKQAR